MKILTLNQMDQAVLEADIVVVGAGPAAYALAHAFARSPVRMLILESGLTQPDERHEQLNAVESLAEPSSPTQIERRSRFHSASAPLWSQEMQGYGVRCRALGGSTHVWAGKSATFDPIDYEARPWAPHSGWPLDQAQMEPYLDRAASLLNLGPNCYDDGFWDLYGVPAPQPAAEPDTLASFFWQFSRSRANRLDLTRIGRELETLDAPNVQVVLDATVTCLRPDADGQSVSHLEVSSLSGEGRTVRARHVVLAAGAIENARLLLQSARATGHPFGNERDLVGRFLMDHPSAAIGRFRSEDCAAITSRFGFYGLNHQGQVHMYLHGLALTPEIQRRERLLNCAAYMMEDRAPDDPWMALKRLIRAESASAAGDMMTVLAGSGLVAKGLGTRLLSGPYLPEPVRRAIIDNYVRYRPNSAVRDYRERGWPHKLTGIDIEAITEQLPQADSRITLSDKTDAFGVPLAQVSWRIDDDAVRSLIRIGQLIAEQCPKMGLPAPVLAPWVLNERPEEAGIIDMAHSAGTTRMASDPAEGVVDAQCAVRGLRNLHVAGASVFPTVGHANPTLMLMGMAIRLADHLRETMAREPRVVVNADAS